MPPPIRRRTTNKEPQLAPWPTAELEERIEEIMDPVQEAGDNHVERVPLACPRSGVHPAKFRSERPRANRGKTGER